MTIFDLWLLTTAIPGIAALTGTGAVFISVAMGGLLIYSLINQGASAIYPELASSQEEAANAKAAFRLIRKMIPYVVGCSLLAVIIPSERQLLLIAGGYTVTNNAEMTKIPSNAAKAVNSWLDAISDAAEPTGKTK